MRDLFEPSKVFVLEYISEVHLGTYTGNFIRRCRLIGGGKFDLMICAVPTMGRDAFLVTSLQGATRPEFTSHILSGTWLEEPKWRKKMSSSDAPVSALMRQELTPREFEGLSVVFYGDHSQGKTMARFALQRLAAYRPGGPLHDHTYNADAQNFREIWVKPLTVEFW